MPWLQRTDATIPDLESYNLEKLGAVVETCRLVEGRVPGDPVPTKKPSTSDPLIIWFRINKGTWIKSSRKTLYEFRLDVEHLDNLDVGTLLSLAELGLALNTILTGKK